MCQPIRLLFRPVEVLMTRKRNVRDPTTAVLVLLLLVAEGWLPVRAQPPESGLRIVVIAGEDAVNVVQQKTAVAPVVEVRDKNDQPVAGVMVRFAVTKGRATFGGARTLSIATNAAGRATVAGLTPTGSGALQISATAAFQGQTAAVTIAQTNVLTVAEASGASATAAGTSGGASGGGGGVSNATIGAISGGAGAAAATAVALNRGKPSAPPTLIGVTPSRGVQGVTVFTFSASGGSGTPVYSWDFGDGATAAGSSVEHIFSTVGTFVVSLKAGTGDGEQSTSKTVIVGTLSGNWSRPAVSGVVNRLSVTQSGSSLTGTWFVEFEPGSPFGTSANNSAVPLRGTITSPLTVSLEQLGDCQRTIPQGQVSSDLNSIGGSGYYGNPVCGDGTGALNSGWTFTRQ
jgi:hypothetical protein